MADLGIVAAEFLRNGAPVLPSRFAGAAVVAGDCVYVDSDELYQLARCDTTEEAARAVGLVLHAANVSTPVLVAYAGLVIAGATAAPVVGTLFYVSATPGKLTAWANLTSGQWVTRLGAGYSATELLMALSVTGEQIP